MSSSFQRFAGLLGILAGLAGLVYLIAFVALKNPAALVPSIALLLVGVFTSATIVALYQRVREVDEGFALWGLFLGLAGAGGAAIHAAFDLANNVNPPATAFGYASPIDPRGFLTFAVAGLGAFVIAWLVLRGNLFTRAVAYVGMAAGALLVLLYIAYMVILNATNPVVLALIFATGILQPIWYLWIGWLLWNAPATAPARTVSTPVSTPPRSGGKRR